MERINTEKPNGLHTNGLRTWGMLFLTLGILGQGIVQNKLLGMSGATSQEMLTTMLDSSGGMIYATLALAMQAVATCGVPIFCFLLVEGFSHTKDFVKYLLRVLGVAVLSELPYNLAMSGKLLDMGSRNPVFAMVLGLMLMYFYNRYQERSFGHFGIKLAVTLAALVWIGMLGIDHGIPCVIMTAVFWAMRKKAVYRNMMGCAAAIACSLVSPFYLASPMGFMVIHYYNGEKGEENRYVSYLAYPVVLLAVGLLAKFAF